MGRSLASATALLISVAALSLAVFTRSGVEYPFTPDSATYVQAASNLLRVGRLAAAPYSIEPFDDVLQPVRVFPPGFPLLVAFVSTLLGTEPRDSALWIGRVAYALVPWLVLVGFRTLVPTLPLLAIGALIVLSPGVFWLGFVGLPDVLFLAFVIASAGLLARADAWRTFFCSGLLAGFAYAVRNAGLAWILAAPIAILLGGATLRRPWTEWPRALAWAFGAAAVAAPLVLYNLVRFGALQPYTMPPSTVPWIVNMREFIASQVRDLSGSRAFGTLLGWDAIALAVALLLAAIAAYRFALPRLAAAEPAERRTLLALAGYALLGAAIVIVARSKYEWGEPVSIRHAAQYSWAWLVFVCVLVFDRAHIRRRAQLRNIVMSIPLVVILMLMRVDDLIDGNAFRADRSVGPIAIASDAKHLAEIQSLPASAMVISNLAYVYTLETGRGARYGDFRKFPTGLYDMCAALQRARAASARTVVILVHPVFGSSELRDLRIDSEMVRELRECGAKALVERPDRLEVRLE